MNTAILIGIYILIIIIDFPYFISEKKKPKLLAIYLFFMLSGMVIGLLLGRINPPISMSAIITNLVNSVVGVINMQKVRLSGIQLGMLFLASFMAAHHC